MVDINTHFYLSIKRKEEFKSFCEFVNVGYKKNSHVETRWLSLLHVIARVLELWPALVSIQERLCNVRYFVKLDKIDTNDVTATEYRRSENQLPDAELSIGEGAQQLIYEMIEEGMEDNVSAFYGSVREFVY